MSLLQAIRASIESPDSADVNYLLLALFQRQYNLNAPYRRFCEANGASQETVTLWRDIPAVPAAAFRSFELACTPGAESAAVFHSSGTTADVASKHYMDSDALDLYELSVTRGYSRAALSFGLSTKQPVWAIMPTPGETPHSSLSHMAATLGTDRWFWDEWAELARALDEAANMDAPMTLFGTAIGFAAFLDALCR